MENLQKSIFTLILSCVLFSCSSNDSGSSSPNNASVNSSYEVVSAAALPNTITSYIASKYAGSTTTEVNLNSDGTYITYVALGAGKTAKTSSTDKNTVVTVKLKFTAKGKLEFTKTHTVIVIVDLLPAITTYISTNYIGATITAAYLDSDGTFDVLIKAVDGGKIKLEFAVDGTFSSAHVFKAHGNHNHNHGDHQTPIAIADLATNITAYISTNYTGATLTSAHKESDGSIDVFITTVDGANLNLNFSIAGDFVSVSSNGNNHSNHENQVAITSLLTEISTYITTNYAGSTITSAELDWNGGFEVHITTAAGARLELNFTSAGTFVVGSDSNNNHDSAEVSVLVQDLIASIKTYISTNYTGATITEAHIESDGSYDVNITTATGTKLKLYFTTTGVFVSIKNN